MPSRTPISFSKLVSVLVGAHHNIATPSDIQKSIIGEMTQIGVDTPGACVTNHCGDFTVLASHRMSLATPQKDDYRYLGVIVYSFRNPNETILSAHISPIFESENELYQINDSNLSDNEPNIRKLRDIPDVLHGNGFTEISFRIIYDVKYSATTERIWSSSSVFFDPYNFPHDPPNYTKVFTPVEMGEQVSNTLEKARKNQLNITSPDNHSLRQALLSVFENADNVRKLIKRDIEPTVFMRKMKNTRAKLDEKPNSVQVLFENLKIGPHKNIITVPLGYFPIRLCEG